MNRPHRHRLAGCQHRVSPGLPALSLGPDVALSAGPLDHARGRPDHPRVTAHRGASIGTKGEPQEQHQHCAAQRGHGADQPNRDLELRGVGIDQHRRSEREGHQTADAQNAEGRRQGFDHHEGDAETDQRKPGIVERQLVERVESKRQTDRADHTGYQRPRIPELEDQPVDTDHHQDQCDIRVGQNAQNARHGIHLDRLDRQALHLDPVFGPGHGDGSSVHGVQQRVGVRCHDIDHVPLQRGRRGEAGGFAHCSFGPIGIAPVQFC